MGFSGKNTGVGCHGPLQEIFPTQGSNPYLLYLLHWQAILYHRAALEALIAVSKDFFFNIIKCFYEQMSWRTHIHQRAF